jgi:hypothetical protein
MNASLIQEGRRAMPRKSRKSFIVTLAVLFAALALTPCKALAHCDGMDGPVVKAAQRALESGNVNLVLIWVQKPDEVEIRKAFDQSMAVRKLGPEARALADRYFFETLVRLHRAGEGAPYTGLKPAGRDLGPAIPAADKALEAGSVEALLKLLSDLVQAGVSEHFKHAVAKSNFDKNDVESGREYVNAYVQFVHYVERIYQAAKNPAHGHYPENEGAGSATEEPAEKAH